MILYTCFSMSKRLISIFELLDSEVSVLQIFKYMMLLFQIRLIQMMKYFIFTNKTLSTVIEKKKNIKIMKGFVIFLV